MSLIDTKKTNDVHGQRRTQATPGNKLVTSPRFSPLIITDPPHRMHDVRGTTWNKPKSHWLLPGSRTKKQLRMDFISEKSQKKSQKKSIKIPEKSLDDELTN